MGPILKAFGTILFGFLVAGYASEDKTASARDASKTTDGSEPVSSSAEKASNRTSDGDRIASGVVEDTLMACLTAIPKEASVGQKMLAEDTCYRESARRERSANRNRIASGAAEDTLMKCLARIPKEASPGQRLLAEDSCRKEHVSQ
jgi:crotonobetainyl-CoA:carnitine CoA-transferase CaiB-like acyl-CoA transferase